RIPGAPDRSALPGSRLAGRARVAADRAVPESGGAPARQLPLDRPSVPGAARLLPAAGARRDTPRRAARPRSAYRLRARGTPRSIDRGPAGRAGPADLAQTGSRPGRAELPAP